MASKSYREALSSTSCMRKDELSGIFSRAA